jgi:hypothetical protein
MSTKNQVKSKFIGTSVISKTNRKKTSCLKTEMVTAKTIPLLEHSIRANYFACSQKLKMEILQFACQTMQSGSIKDSFLREACSTRDLHLLSHSRLNDYFPSSAYF